MTARKDIPREHPRLRGEYFGYLMSRFYCEGTPPHARGIQTRLNSFENLVGNTPAGAGNTQDVPTKSTSSQEHPRLRGEYSGSPKVCAFWRGTPPLARGIPKSGTYCDVVQGNTPVCAGNKPIPFTKKSTVQDHPRLRGEYSFFLKFRK